MADRNLARALDRADQERDAANAEAAAERLRETSYLRGRNGDHSQEWVEFYRSQIAAAVQMRERAAERLGKRLDEAATWGR